MARVSKKDAQKAAGRIVGALQELLVVTPHGVVPGQEDLVEYARERGVDPIWAACSAVASKGVWIDFVPRLRKRVLPGFEVTALIRSRPVDGSMVGVTVKWPSRSPMRASEAVAMAAQHMEAAQTACHFEAALIGEVGDLDPRTVKAGMEIVMGWRREQWKLLEQIRETERRRRLRGEE